MHRTPLSTHAAALALVLALFAGGCAGRKKSGALKPPKIGQTETGMASWYGNPYHGRRAANGEIYDMEKLTAAHRTLPFETWVRVYNLDSGKKVEVRITDRGPFVKGRVIDLSRAAARDVNMLGTGTAKVKIQVIRAPSKPERDIFGVQIGAFKDKNNAENLRKRMEKSYGSARIVVKEGSTPLWRVVVGRASTQEGAEELAEKLRSQDSGAFVVRLDE
jgi:rare lipoprotein A